MQNGSSAQWDIKCKLHILRNVRIIYLMLQVVSRVDPRLHEDMESPVGLVIPSTVYKKFDFCSCGILLQKYICK